MASCDKSCEFCCDLKIVCKWFSQKKKKKEEEERMFLNMFLDRFCLACVSYVH